MWVGVHHQYECTTGHHQKSKPFQVYLGSTQYALKAALSGLYLSVSNNGWIGQSTYPTPWDLTRVTFDYNTRTITNIELGIGKRDHDTCPDGWHFRVRNFFHEGERLANRSYEVFMNLGADFYGGGYPDNEGAAHRGSMLYEPSARDSFAYSYLHYDADGNIYEKAFMTLRCDPN
ncbi:hypothetical protein AB0M48_30125 [Lentzea sp. NPDC051208]|uniref:hypothetical protein n=1 Tax=Lentzea sp. NPDC051208 TaxID=3154642 RepID=UPI00342773D2